MAQPGAEGINDPLSHGESASPWACHQELDHKLSTYAKQQSVGSHFVSEGAPHISAPSVPHYDETSDDDNYQPGLGALPQNGVREPGLVYLGIIDPERLSRESPARLLPAPLPRKEEFGTPRQPVMDWGLPDYIPRYVWHKCNIYKEMLA